jgi:hypothetical protein
MSSTYGNPVYGHLIELKESIGSDLSRRDRAAVLIGACITHGFDTKHQIYKGLRVAGLSANLVRDVLEELTGDVVGLHQWQSDADGQYHLLG